MKTIKLKSFRIWTITRFWIGCQDIKAKSHKDAFNRIGKTLKLRCTSIEDLENNESITIEELLNMPLI